MHSRIMSNIEPLNFNYMRFAIIFLAFCTYMAGQTPINNTKTSSSDSGRYVVYSNRIDRRVPRSRSVAVLLDPASFDKRTLVELFSRLSERFPRPHLLTIELFTDLRDVETPDEEESGKTSEDPDERQATGNSAVFIRTRETQYFYMYYSTGEFEEISLPQKRRIGVRPAICAICAIPILLQTARPSMLSNARK